METHNLVESKKRYFFFFFIYTKLLKFRIYLLVFKIKASIIHIQLISDGPLAQRVSSSSIVVKCEKDESRPLGYLHTSFLSNNNLDNGGHRFGCTCNLVINKKKNVSILSLNTPEIHPSNSPEVKTRCIHFYSCIAAFSSDPALAKEFARDKLTLRFRYFPNFT